jgi:signal transduction histidine kinase
MDEAGGRLLRSEPVAFESVVSDVVATYGHARAQVHLSTSVPSVVAGDADGLRRVVINLVDNAVRYARSQVNVSLEHGEYAGQRSVTLHVIDDGRGIDPSERDRVFDRFYRVQASRSRESGGTGLGLSIVRDVVRAHLGTVQLRARPDGGPGLDAMIVLPLADPASRS